MVDLFLVTRSINSDSDEFVGVFTSPKKAMNCLKEIFNSLKIYKTLATEPVEMDTIHVYFWTNENHPVRHYYISKLNINKSYAED